MTIQIELLLLISEDKNTNDIFVFEIPNNEYNY